MMAATCSLIFVVYINLHFFPVSCDVHNTRQLLGVCVDESLARLPRRALYPSHQQYDGYKDGGYYQHAAVLEPDQVLEGPTRDRGVPLDNRRLSQQKLALQALQARVSYMAGGIGRLVGVLRESPVNVSSIRMCDARVRVKFVSFLLGKLGGQRVQRESSALLVLNA